MAHVGLNLIRGLHSLGSKYAKKRYFLLTGDCFGPGVFFRTCFRLFGAPGIGSWTHFRGYSAGPFVSLAPSTEGATKSCSRLPYIAAEDPESPTCGLLKE